MLAELFPKVHRSYSSLPVLGSVLEGFAEWLSEQGYPRRPICRHVCTARHIDRALQLGGCRAIDEITREVLHACTLARSHDDLTASTVRLLERYLDAVELLPPCPPPTRLERELAAYAVYLKDVRGLERATIAQHVSTAAQFLERVGYEKNPSCLSHLTSSHIEAFVRFNGERLCRGSLQHVIAQLRSFLRFLAAQGQVPPGLDAQIDTPRMYRLEQLPKTLPWDMVRAFLRSIDRRTPLGLRDYAIFLLIATYGLRASEIVALTLDDIHWRERRIEIHQRKTATPLELPLTDAVAQSFVDYLRRARPPLSYRELFLRARAPAGVLKPTAVTEAFQAWSRRSGLGIPFQGPHCLRHSYAVHLLRQGVSLKAIGDLLGHRSPESTCVYLRLAVEDLRDVALDLPADDSLRTPEEVRP